MICMQPERDSVHIQILAPMIVKEIGKVGNRARRFVLVPKNEAELGCRVSFDKLACMLRHMFVDCTEGQNSDSVDNI